jgi:hypothetical protein
MAELKQGFGGVPFRLFFYAMDVRPKGESSLKSQTEQRILKFSQQYSSVVILQYKSKKKNSAKAKRADNNPPFVRVVSFDFLLFDKRL